MSQYYYSPLSPGANNIRLLRLMPHANKSTKRTKLQCQLFEYSLHDMGQRTHLYEALSYTWGGGEKPHSITIEEQNLNVTTNLYTALLHLRDRSLERIIWIDAICINQDNPEEQGQQVQLMAMIYSKAYRVLVWLGAMANEVEGALEDIGRAASEEFTEHSNEKMNQSAILNLLQRPWFQRIWVLQEVAAARHVVIMCGSTEIDGYAFCLGLKSLRKSEKLSFTARPELQSLPSLINLIEQAGLRPRYTTNSLEGHSLKIRPLPELVDMFHTRQASDPRDMVYALLGMSSDDPGQASLQPDYRIAWEKLFQLLIKFILGKDVSVEISSQSAMIKSKGYILGQVSWVRSDDTQNVKIKSRDVVWNLGGKTEWTLHASAKSIREGDIICLIQGASKPSIIRQFKDHFAVIVIAATPLNDGGSFGSPETSQSITHFLRDFLLIWDWRNAQVKSQDQEEYETLTKSFSQALEHSEAEFGNYLNTATRLWNTITILDDLGEHEKADEKLREATSSYIVAFKKEPLPRLSSQHGRTLMSFAAGEGDEDIVKLLLETVDPNLKDGKSGQTPLFWATRNRHEAVVKLLLASKVDTKFEDWDGQTPLSLAAEKGHEAIFKLLLVTGKADADLDYRFYQTPLSLAASNGHEAIIKLLLETSKADTDLDYRFYETPLSLAASNGYEAIVKLLLEADKANANLDYWKYQKPLFLAAKNGHDAVVKLLLETGKVDADRDMDNNGSTPLSLAAKNGHEAVVKLLLETGKVDTDLQNWYRQKPLSWAAKNGHEAVVKLLLETGKVDINCKDENNTTPLFWAAGNGHKAVVKLLLETGKADTDLQNWYRQTPLSWAAKNGHEAVVKLLLETGKVDINCKDENSTTPLFWAAGNGHEAVLKLLLETGKANANFKDRYGLTPLFWAARNGFEAVVRLLLETGKVDINCKDKDSSTALCWAARNGHKAVVKLLKSYQHAAYSESGHLATAIVSPAKRRRISSQG